MGQTKLQSRAVWALAERQHGVVARRQLLAHGLSAGAIHHRIENGRLHQVHRGVYAVGRPQLTRYGSWMAAVLACGTRAALGARLTHLPSCFTDSELERRFLPVARRAGLRSPLTQQWVNGFEVGFYWPDLGLVVETDGLGYHRTPAQQARDRVRDQAHMAAGLTPLHFTHPQVRYEPERVRATLAATAARLRAHNPHP
jgi:very-short-patch-repair endonuclease